MLQHPSSKVNLLSLTLFPLVVVVVKVVVVVLMVVVVRLSNPFTAP
jgi:hypothetical protein